MRIELKPATEYQTATYGILFESAHVYRTRYSHSPTRVVVWDNTRRVNNERNGRYRDPRNKATDSERSILLSTEAIVIDAHGTGTGTRASGQVYKTDAERLADGDTLTLVYPDGTEQNVKACFPRFDNGHGHAEDTRKGA